MSRLVVKTIKVRLIAFEVVGSSGESGRKGGEGRGPRRSEEAIRGAQIASGGTIAAAHSSSSIAIISTSSWDILDDRTHTTNPTSYLSY
jgi:hypothetical protein